MLVNKMQRKAMAIAGNAPKKLLKNLPAKIKAKRNAK